MSRINQHVTLLDGRVLGYDDYGPATGKPLFYFHGTPSSRLEWQMFGSEQLATELHLRVISMDRPGMGLSDFQPARRLGDWPTDVIALADRLDIGRFAVLGYSGGGPYAAVCAFAIPERLNYVGIVSGAGSFAQAHSSEGVNAASRRFFDLCRDKPMRGRLMLRLMGAIAHYAPQHIIKETMAAISESQSHFYQEEGHLSLFANHLRDILAVFAADAPISV